MLQYSKKEQVSIKKVNNYLLFQSKNFFERHIGYIFPKHHIKNDELCFDDKNFKDKDTYLKKRESFSKKIIEKFNSIDKSSFNEDEKLLLDNFQIEWLSVDNLYMDKDRSIKVKVWGVKSKYIEHLDPDYIPPLQLAAQKKEKEQREKDKKTGNIIIIILLAANFIFFLIDIKEQRERKRIEHRKSRIEERDSKITRLKWGTNKPIKVTNEIKAFKNGTSPMIHEITNNSEYEIEEIHIGIAYYTKAKWWESTDTYYDIERDTILLDIDDPRGKPGSTDIYTQDIFVNTSKNIIPKNYYVYLYGYKPILK